MRQDHCDIEKRKYRVTHWTTVKGTLPRSQQLEKQSVILPWPNWKDGYCTTQRAMSFGPRPASTAGGRGPPDLPMTNTWAHPSHPYQGLGSSARTGSRRSDEKVLHRRRIYCWHSHRPSTIPKRVNVEFTGLGRLLVQEQAYSQKRTNEYQACRCAEQRRLQTVHVERGRWLDLEKAYHQSAKWGSEGVRLDLVSSMLAVPPRKWEPKSDYTSVDRIDCT